MQFTLGSGDLLVIITLSASLTALVTFILNKTIEGFIKHRFDRQLEGIKAANQKEMALFQNGLSQQMELFKSNITKNIEDYKFEFKKREQAAKIAELFSEFYYPAAGKADLGKINKMIWELSLWLPAPVIRTLAPTLNGQPGSLDIKAVLIEIRKQLLQEAKDDLKSVEILHFTNL